ncbi:MAG: hypothetical protein ABSF94_15280 [Steroidobacteraceae bacterium]
MPDPRRCVRSLFGVLGTLIISISSVCAADEPRSEAAAPSDDSGPPPAWLPVWDPPKQITWLSASDISNWSFGGFAGVYNHGRLIIIEVEPWRVRNDWARDYMIGANAVYKIAHLPLLPVDFELDLSVGDLVGKGNNLELGALPELRWKWFPWNKFLYTNMRWGPTGVSYTTGLSAVEASDTTHDRTSRFLNLDVFEWTFAPNDHSRWEAFIRNQHRSGIYGLINGVSGGSNYVNVGMRAHF